MGGTASRPDDYVSNAPRADGSDGCPPTPQSLFVDDRDENGMNSITPVDFRWSFGGHSVYVTGAWDDWRVKAALAQITPTEFSTVLALPVGTFQYKFIVDGNWKHSPAYTTETDQHGNLNNVVTVTPQELEYDSNDSFIPNAPRSPMESYDYSTLPQEDQTTEPPTLPRLLASARLDKQSGNTGTDFVRLNHIFGTRSEISHGAGDIRTMASEVRYKSKVVTTILVTSRSKTQRVLGMSSQAYSGKRTHPIPVGGQRLPPIAISREHHSLNSRQSNLHEDGEKKVLDYFRRRQSHDVSKERT